MRTAVLITGLLLLLAANIIMMYIFPYGVSPLEGFRVKRQGFQNVSNGNNNNGNNNANNNANVENFRSRVVPMSMLLNRNRNRQGFQNVPLNNNNGGLPNNNAPANNNSNAEGFASYQLQNAGGAKDQQQAIGGFDGVKLSTGNTVSGWRYTAPNEPLTGAEFQPGPDSLFMFKNNQCKPECCGASFSCDGGCVCTTPQQRQQIAERGGNRTQPEDSA